MQSERTSEFAAATSQSSVFQEPQKISKQLVCFRKTKNYQSEEQAVFIALLNMKYDIVIERPFKAIKASSTFFKIVKLVNAEEVIDVKSEVENSIEQLLENDRKQNVPVKTIKRRNENYKIVEHIHNSIGLLQSLGYNLIINKTNKKKTSAKYKTVTISFDGICFNQNDIERKGKMIIDVIDDKMKHLSRKNNIIIPRGDTEFMSILLSDIVYN